jgi:hypothetical protein
MPAPSPRTKPLALASKALQRPSGESMDAAQNAMKLVAMRMMFTPPANARSHSRSQMLWQARCVATSAEEQAVSTAMLGPRRFRQ